MHKPPADGNVRALSTHIREPLSTLLVLLLRKWAPLRYSERPALPPFVRNSLSSLCVLEVANRKI